MQIQLHLSSIGKFFFSLFISMNVDRSQTQMVWSPQAVANFMPFGLKVTVRAVSLCFRVNKHFPVDTFQTLTV